MLSIKIRLKYVKCRLITGIFTFLDNFMFSCRQTSVSLLSSSCYSSYIPVLSVDVYTTVDH
jgi:hypothetical protein